jgi:hypothetical protein
VTTILKNTKEVILLNISENSFSSTTEVAPPDEPRSEPFQPHPGPCQTKL